MEKRLCPECETPLLGRADKKFCSDQCRNNWHNRQNRDDTLVVRNINNILRRNRRILQDLNVKDKTPVKRKKMADKGFDWRYVTEQFSTKSGRTYSFCYDMGYVPLDDDTVLIVVREEH